MGVRCSRWLRSDAWLGLRIATTFIANRGLFGDTGADLVGWRRIADEVAMVRRAEKATGVDYPDEDTATPAWAPTRRAHAHGVL